MLISPTNLVEKIVDGPAQISKECIDRVKHGLNGVVHEECENVISARGVNDSCITNRVNQAVIFVGPAMFMCDSDT